MNQSWQQIGAKDGFIAVADTEISDYDARLVSQLYQPIGGPDITALYMTLKNNLKKQPILTDRMMIKNLLLGLNTGLKGVRDAAEKLEALGLLRTFYREDKIGQVLIFQLNKPLDPQQFFDNKTLSGLLRDTVGEGYFKSLEAQLVYDKSIVKRGENVSHGLREIFPGAVQELQPGQKQGERLKQVVDADYLFQLIEKSFVSLADVESHLDHVADLALLYGLNEPQLLKLLEQAADLTSGKIQWNRLDQIAADNYVNPKLKPAGASAAGNNSENNQAASAPAGQEERELIAAANAYAPMEFFTDIMQARNGYITNAERYAVQDLVRKDVLPGPVINILIHYMLVDQNMGNLKVGMLQKIASDWAQHRISRPEQALNYVQKRKKKQESQRENRRPYYSSRKVIQKETVPDWDKEAEKRKKQYASGPKHSKEIAQNLKQLQQMINKRR